jgi:uncharacterized protein YigA (DUF484 family)
VSNTQGVQGITEQDIADFLANTPGFFERHAELLGTVQLTSPHGQRAVSLQERQMEMLRDRIKGLEMKIVEMIRHGQENVAIADRLHRWTRRVLLTTDAAALPQVIVDELRHQYLIPQAAIRVWGVGEHMADHDFARAVSADAKAFAASLTVPYCGANNGFEAASWLEEAATVQSLALVPLRDGNEAFGMLVLGSPDPTRYSADMGTEFLERIGELAGAALSRLRVA